MTYMKKNARKAKIRRQIIVVFIALLAATGLYVLLGTQARYRHVQASTNQQILYKSIRVNAGDTLWTIADEYMGTAYADKEDYIDEVKEINHLSNTDIQAGSYLMVPYAAVVQ